MIDRDLTDALEKMNSEERQALLAFLGLKPDDLSDSASAAPAQKAGPARTAPKSK